jgi:hypothetical protein
MLVGVSVITYIVVVVVGVRKEQVIFGKNKGTAHINTG